jgi:prepilin-type N-terminal cleavage/methylation domain-containing protein
MNFSDISGKGCSADGICREPSGRFCKHCGFTLVELVVIVAILGVLALLSIPVYSDYTNTAKLGRTAADIRTLEKEINAYSIENGRFPNGLDDIKRDTLRDAWGNPYKYQDLTVVGATPMEDFALDTLNSTDYFDLYSKGKDGDTSEVAYVEATCRDDVVLRGDGGDVGTLRSPP